MATPEFFDANIRLGPGLEFIESMPGNLQRIDGRPTGVPEILEAMGEAGVTRALVYHPISYEYNAAYGNERLLAEIAGHDNLFPVFMIYPTGTGEMGNAADIRDFLIKSRAAGVLLYPGSYRFRAGGNFSVEDWNMGDLYEMLESINMPVFTRLNTDLKFGEADKLLQNHPKLRIVLREVSLASDRDLFGFAHTHRLNENFRIETTDYKSLFGIDDFTGKFGSEKLIFGSGYPFQNIGGAVAPILLSKLGDREKENIARRNLERLMGEIRYE
jgi:predicted TIM-barrel fold metal-dependent hydrolase